MSEPDELDTVPEPNPLDRLERPPAWERRAARALRGPRPAGSYVLAAELEGVAAGVWQARADAWRAGRDGGPGSG